VLPAAGFIKAQAYIPLTQSRWVYSTPSLTSLANIHLPQVGSLHRPISACDSREFFRSGRQRSVPDEFGGHSCAGHTRVRSQRHPPNDLCLTPRSGVDGNVPTWHSRELVSVLSTWAPDAIVRCARSLLALLFDYPRARSLREETGQGHWYPSVFRNAHVKAFLDSVLSEERRPPRRSPTFTLTSAVPAETGSLHGWRILKLLVPGR